MSVIEVIWRYLRKWGMAWLKFRLLAHSKNNRGIGWRSTQRKKHRKDLRKLEQAFAAL